MSNEALNNEKIKIQSEISSDYPPPPKIDGKNFHQFKDKKDELGKDKILTYKKNVFNILKKEAYSYKSNRVKNDEINFDNALYIKVEDNSPGPECLKYKKNKISNELKKKYMKDFLGNMRNYSKGINRSNFGKSPNFERKKQISEINDGKKKIYTHKKIKNNNLMTICNNDSKKNEFTIEQRTDNIFISSCYDNPQRNELLRIINLKKKKDPDKIIEFLFPPMMPIPQFQNIYPSPYMYMMPPPQFPMQGVNNNNNDEFRTPDEEQNLTDSQKMVIKNKNQIRVNINNTPNPNSIFFNDNLKDAKKNNEGNI